MNERTKYPISVLVVDDEPTIVEQLFMILSRRIETVYTASNGQEALERYRALAPDVIISDVDMPVMNGIELLKEVRKNDSNFPFILSTGLKNLDILIEAIGQGITAFLPKPLQLRDLLQRLENVVQTKMLEKDLKKSRDLLEQYKTIVDASSIVSKSDLDGNITYANEMFCKISGFTSEELIGRSHNIVRDPEMPSNVFAHMWETIRAKKIWHGTIHNRAKDGSRYTVKSTIAPILDENGEIVEYIGLREDITDVMVKEKKIREERKKLDDILNHVDSIVAMVSVSEKLLFANQKFFDTFPFTNFAEFKSKHDCICDLFVVCNGYLQQKMGELYWIEYISANPQMQHHAKMLDKAGHERIFSVNLQKTRADEKELFVVTLNDITDIQKAKEEAREAARLKGEFLANMSHEIRTPMNGILGFTSLLSQSELNEKQKRYLDIINGSTQTLLGIINDILDFSKLESGKLELDFTAINPIVEFEKIAQIFHARMEEKKIIFDIDIDPMISECIEIDLLRLQQVVTNLLSNAVKFTPEEGNIVFYAQCMGRTEEFSQLRIGVRDSGIGISSEQQARIFEAFSQADSSTTRQFGGTGLGLSISTHLVSLMGGTLNVNSELGKGSDFYFTISVKRCIIEHPLASLFASKMITIVPSDHPECMKLVSGYLNKLGIGYRTCDDTIVECEKGEIVIAFCEVEQGLIEQLIQQNITTVVVCSRAINYTAQNIIVIPDLDHNLSALYNVLLSIVQEDAINETAHMKESPVHFAGSVLVAEDNPINQMLIREFLQRYRLHPEIVDDGAQALEHLEGVHYDLVLMDVNMPVMSGPEAALEIKKRGVHTPLIALTANAMVGDRERFLAQGFDGYLSKPIVLDELEKVLEMYLSKILEDTRDSDGKGSNTTEANARTETLLDMDRIRKELPLPDAVLLKLLKTFSTNAEASLMELKDAVTKGDKEKMYQSSHYIKGAVGNLRIEAIESVAAEIESLSRQNANADYAALYRLLESRMQTVCREIEQVLEENR